MKSAITTVSERLTYTNIAVNPDGTLRPWRGVNTTTNPPVLKSDGQITWLPIKKRNYFCTSCPNPHDPAFKCGENNGCK